VIILITILVIVLDQLTKSYFSSTLVLAQTQPIINNVFHLTLVHNTGIAFGLFRGATRIVIIGAIFVCIFLFIGLRKEFGIYLRFPSVTKKRQLVNKMAVGFILGGALSNMLDRLRFGYVIDFLDFRVWPVFNFADSFITIGAGILILNFFISQKVLEQK